MKKRIALVTTTINIPQVLLQYDAATRYTDAQVRMFITGDVSSPDAQIEKMLSLINCPRTYYTYKQQQDRWPELSKVIGPKKIQRRNFSYLMAMQDWNPDIVVTVDDDNKPVSIKNYYNTFCDLQGKNLTSLKSLNSTKANPFTNTPTAKQFVYKRGYSVSNRNNNSKNMVYYQNTFQFNVGVLQGIAVGDPDIDAITRLNCDAKSIQTFMQGIIKHGYSWTYPHDMVPYNSQNTAFIKQILPYQFLFPFVGRYDDILAGYLSQVVMGKQNFAVAFGKPYAVQLRNKHNLIKDIKDQIWGMQWIDNIIDNILIPARDNPTKMTNQELYFDCLSKIAGMDKDFDVRNVEAARIFFEELNDTGVKYA